jgi:hypothetical protein
MKTTFRAKWDSDAIEVSADWDQPDYPIKGLDSYSVSRARHSPLLALKIALERHAASKGLNVLDLETKRRIQIALENAVMIYEN